MKVFNRLTAISVALIIVLTMLFSAAFLSCNVHHNCDGEDCPVCETMQMAESVLNRISMAIAVTAVALSLCISAQESMAVFSDAITYYSPIKLKVKMLN